MIQIFLIIRRRNVYIHVTNYLSLIKTALKNTAKAVLVWHTGNAVDSTDLITDPS